MIPDEWQPIPLEHCGNWFSGGTPSRQNPEYWNGDIPWISGKSLHTHFISDAEEYVTPEGAKNGTRLVPTGTILLLVRGMMLHKKLPVGITTREVTFNQDVKAIIPHDDVCGEFLLYWFLAYERQLLRYKEESSHGTGRMPTDLLLRTEVDLPPLPEQRAIAAILSTWDEAITLTERLIAALQDRKLGLMQRLLTGAVRFPAFEGEEWRETTLGEFFYAISERNKANEDLTVLSCSKIYGIVPQTQVFDRRVASVNTQNYKIVELGDLVIDPNLLWDTSLNFLEEVDKGIVSPAYTTLRFRHDDGDVRQYFKYLLKTHYYREHYKFISQGTNVRRNKAPTSAFLGLKVLIGPPEEQSRITEVLQDCDDQLDTLKAYDESLKTQKKGLMQRLLTGQLRVRVDY